MLNTQLLVPIIRYARTRSTQRAQIIAMLKGIVYLPMLTRDINQTQSVSAETKHLHEAGEHIYPLF